MQPVSWLRRLRRHAADFLVAQRGNIAVTFVIALIPILTFIGAAIDYSRASLARTAMQTALDSTALMLSRDLASGHHHAIADRFDGAGLFCCALYQSGRPVGFDQRHLYAGQFRRGPDHSAERLGRDYDRLHGSRRLPHDGLQRQFDHNLGGGPAPHRPGPRQHQLDERLQQDRRAQDGRQDISSPSWRGSPRTTETSTFPSFRSKPMSMSAPRTSARPGCAGIAGIPMNGTIPVRSRPGAATMAGVRPWLNVRTTGIPGITRSALRAISNGTAV